LLPGTMPAWTCIARPASARLDMAAKPCSPNPPVSNLATTCRPGVGLRDLGEHRLKDLTEPQRLFQVVIPGLPAEFPPLRTLGPRPDDLPTPLTRFIGRRRELAQACALLRREEVRLLT
jgi:hypothetical protein